jgi:hypothetical protein
MKSLSDEARQIARVVDMRMGNQHCVQSSRIEGRLLPVSFAEFTNPLVEAAVEQDAGLAVLDDKGVATAAAAEGGEPQSIASGTVADEAGRRATGAAGGVRSIPP